MRFARLIPLLACLYLPWIGGGLLTDDYVHLERLSSIDSPMRLIDRPDAFRFYRPVTQATLALDLAAHRRPALARAVNVALYACTLALVLAVARQVLVSPFAAALATTAFALTPKAHPIAVLWLSARAELLMGIFVLLTVFAWITWTRRGGVLWLSSAAAAYALAVLSKETALLLPLLLLLTPGARRPSRERTAAIAALCVLAAALYAWRFQVGALTPFSAEGQYGLMTGAGRWLRSVENYLGRMIAAPLGLVVVAAVLRLLAKHRASEPSEVDTAAARAVGRASLFPLAWTLLLLVPVLPLVARSELYLYLPVFGICLLAGGVADVLLRAHRGKPIVTAGIVMYVVALGGYQTARAAALHDDLVFSEQLVEALRTSTELSGRAGRLVLVPSEPRTEQFLRDAIGGYLPVVLRLARGEPSLSGAVSYAGETVMPGQLHLECAYVDGVVVLKPAPAVIGSMAPDSLGRISEER